MSKHTTTKASIGNPFEQRKKIPVILVAYAAEGVVTRDRYGISTMLTGGRSEACDLTISDENVSSRHFRITKLKGTFVLEDLGSTNGTFLNGHRVDLKTSLPERAVIRIGQVILVFLSDGEHLLTPPVNTHGIAGRFHAYSLIQRLLEASLSSRHILLTGPSGTGKELSAQALASMMGGAGSLLTHNAAQFASEEEASTTLFGVGPKVFSDVRERAGLIETAHDGVLFLDEAHNLPMRVQKSLLRVIEDGETKRIGETRSRPAQVRFILATNVDSGTFGLAHDLFARLRKVAVPTLAERLADIPTIFTTVLGRILSEHGIEQSTVLPVLAGDHFEALMLDGFARENVRGLLDLADRVATKISSGVAPREAIMGVFAESFEQSAVVRRHRGALDQNGDAPPPDSSSQYEGNKEAIVKAFHKCSGNVSAMTRQLREQGITCSRRWISVYVKRWGLR